MVLFAIAPVPESLDTDVSGYALSMKIGSMNSGFYCAAALMLAVMISPNSVAQEALPKEHNAPHSEEAAAHALSIPVPAPMKRHPSNPIFLRGDPLDIPQWAKDEGHNGFAVYTATVGTDGNLVSLVLKRSSNSAAIDEAVRRRAEAMYYAAGTNAAGEKVESSVDVRMSYARFDTDSPGGGIVDYTCADLIREYDWFKIAHPSGRPIFWPENAFTSLTNMTLVIGGSQPSIEERRANRRQGEKAWDKLIRQCRREPQTLLLDHIAQRESFRDLVEAF